MTASLKRSPSLADTLEVLDSVEGYAVGITGRVLCVVWRTRVSVPGVAVVTRGIEKLLQGDPTERFGVLVHVESACELQKDNSVFQACVEELKRHGRRMAGYAVVYNREGFWNAAMRGRVMAIGSESKSEVPFAMRPTLLEACGWLRQLEELTVPALDELVSAMESLRTHPARD